MARYLSSVRKQLQDVSDLFTARYGKNSNIAEMAIKALVSAALLEHEVTLLEGTQQPTPHKDSDGIPAVWEMAAKSGNQF